MGTFRCGLHNFTCDLISEWREHAQEEAHTYVGNTGCEQCGKPVKFEKTAKIAPKRAVPLIMCEECSK